jgi:hypothetical protein
MMSYSPVIILIAEHLTEAVIVTSFSGQLIYPRQPENTKQTLYINLFNHLKVKNLKAWHHFIVSELNNQIHFRFQLL